MRYKLCKLCEIVQGIRPCGAFIFQISVKSELKFQFWGSYTLVVAPMGVKFGTEEGPSSVPNFTPIGATCRPCGAKKLKIGL